jgi:protein gp37
VAETAIAWTGSPQPDGSVLPGYTYNPWWGCTKVSTGCDHCYAEALDKRVGGGNGRGELHWGPHAERRRMGQATLTAPLNWNRHARNAKRRRRVFCASLADVFDNAVPPEWRTAMWSIIRQTPWLDWQLLTKRPQNIREMLPPDWGDGWGYVWLGVSAENQEEANRRIPILLDIPAQTKFISFEPLLGPIQMKDIPGMNRLDLNWNWWVIVGGESGPGARPMRESWAINLVEQCANAAVPVFVKQLGGVSNKRANPLEWTRPLRVQDFPRSAIPYDRLRRKDWLARADA